MKILVVNCGSSSLKFQLIDSETEEVAASGLCERIGLDGALIYKVNGDKIKQEIDLPDHEVASKKVFDIKKNGMKSRNLFRKLKKKKKD